MLQCTSLSIIIFKNVNTISFLQAHKSRKDYGLAAADYKKVLELEPENKAAKSQMAACKKEQQQELQREKKLYANMFSSKTETKVGGRLFFIKLTDRGP